MRGSHGLLLYGVENSGKEIAIQTTGKAPVNSGTVTTGLPDGRTAVVAAVVVGVTWSNGRFGSTLQHILFGSVCGPEDGKQAGLMFSGGPGGAEDLREEILPKCHAGSAWLRQWHAPYAMVALLEGTLSQNEVNERQHSNGAIAHIVTQGHNGTYWPTLQINNCKHKVAIGLMDNKIYNSFLYM